MIHIVRGFSVVSEAEVDVFLKSSCLLCDPVNVDSLGLMPFLNPAYTYGSSQFMYLKHSLKDFEHDLAIM